MLVTPNDSLDKVNVNTFQTLEPILACRFLDIYLILHRVSFKRKIFPTAHRVGCRAALLISRMDQAAGHFLSGCSLAVSLVSFHSPPLFGVQRQGTSVPSTWKAQMPRDFGSKDTFSNPNPTVTKTKAESLSLENPS